MHYKLKNVINVHRDFTQSLSEEKWLASNLLACVGGALSLYRSQQRNRGYLSTMVHAFWAYTLAGNLPVIREQIELSKEQRETLKQERAIREAESMLRHNEGGEIEAEDLRDAAIQIAKNMFNQPVPAEPVKDGERLTTGLGYPYEAR